MTYTIGDKHQRDRLSVQRATGMGDGALEADDRRRGVRVRGGVVVCPRNDRVIGVA